MTRTLCLLFVLLLVLLWQPVAAVAGIPGNGPLVIEQDSAFRQLNIAPYISQYRGNTPPADALAASAEPDSAFSPVGTASPLRLRETSWFRFSIRNNTAQPRSLVLDLDQALLARIEWRAQAGAVVSERVTGQNYPYTSRDVDYDFFAFRLHVPAGETLIVNFSIYTPYAALFVPKLTDSENFFSQLTFSGRFAGSVMGMLYAICFFLFLYILRMKKWGMEHAMFVFSLACFASVLYLSGIVQRHLPDGGVPWRDIAYIIIHGLQGIAFCTVLRGFYQTSRHYPFFEKLLLWLSLAELCIFLLLPCVNTLAWANIEYFLVATLVVNSVVMLSSISLTILALVRRHASTYLFSAGLLLFAMMTMISSLAAFGILPVSFLTRYGYELGLTIQVDFLFLALVARIFSAEREKLAMESEIVRLDIEMKARSEFVERVTHDIKSPLSAVLGAVQLFREKKTEQDGEAYLGIIQRACASVISIVDDILSHSRMKSGQIPLHNELFSLQDLLSDIEFSVQASQQHKGLAFSVAVGADVPPLILGDKRRVSQLLINLLTNAFKFTDEGRVSLMVELAGTMERSVVIRFVVQDTGIGMSEHFLQQAFEPYTREENRAGYRPGFGLGLSICKQIVERMDGSIDVLSAVGQGSRFTVLLPFALPE